MTKLIPNDIPLINIDCHLHSRFSPDACNAGADDPDGIVAAVRARGLRGFIVTDHVDIGHWQGCKPIDFKEYFATWNRVREKNPDLEIYIGLEVGFERDTAADTAALLKDLPLEYVINSVHYWQKEISWRAGADACYSDYLDCVSASLDAPYEFSTVGHLGFPERFAPYPPEERAITYKKFKDKLDIIIKKAVARGVRFEENTNAGGEMRMPREDFLRAYKAAGGIRPPVGADAHVSKNIGNYFDIANAFLDGIFGKAE